MRYAAPALRRLLPALAALALLAIAVATAQATPGGNDESSLPPLPVQPPSVPSVSPVPTLPVGGACRSASQPGVDAQGALPIAPNPLAGLTFFVDPEEPSWRQWHYYQRRGMGRRASLVWRIASQPKFQWFGKWTRHGPALVAKMQDYFHRVDCQQPGAVPLMAVMRHQGRQCNPHYQAGGAREDAAQRLWYDRFARAIGNHRVVIAFEPDSLGTVHCLARSRRMARLRALRYGVDVFSKLPNATVYLESGASDWAPARKTAWQLRYIGISKVRGFMLNVTHYDWTANNIRYGMKISRLTGGKHFIISTAFNGRGPVHYRKYLSRSRNIWRTINIWCHPLKRGLGIAPTTNTHQAKVDAFMWIGRPGYSGGGCNGGPRRVGAWWAKRALMFGKYATNWLRPPRGSRNGLFGHFSLRQLGGP
jgi:endoglucanase